ncbi:hypothetical protein ACFWPH_33420 [Nocardia sp. NPDC058499]
MASSIAEGEAATEPVVAAESAARIVDRTELRVAAHDTDPTLVAPR